MAEVLGHWTCSEGNQAVVTQTKNGGHFFTKCDCCGYSQGRGAARQAKIWRDAVWLEGVTPRRPNNVPETADTVPEPEPVKEVPEVPEVPKAKPEQADTGGGDFDPEIEPEAEPEPEPEASSGLGKVIAGCVFLGVAGVAALWKI